MSVLDAFVEVLRRPLLFPLLAALVAGAQSATSPARYTFTLVTDAVSQWQAANANEIALKANTINECCHACALHPTQCSVIRYSLDDGSCRVSSTSVSLGPGLVMRVTSAAATAVGAAGGEGHSSNSSTIGHVWSANANGVVGVVVSASASAALTAPAESDPTTVTVSTPNMPSRADQKFSESGTRTSDAAATAGGAAGGEGNLSSGAAIGRVSTANANGVVGVVASASAGPARTAGAARTAPVDSNLTTATDSTPNMQSGSDQKLSESATRMSDVPPTGIVTAATRQASAGNCPVSTVTSRSVSTNSQGFSVYLVDYYSSGARAVIGLPLPRPSDTSLVHTTSAYGIIFPCNLESSPQVNQATLHNVSSLTPLAFIVTKSDWQQQVDCIEVIIQFSSCLFLDAGSVQVWSLANK